MLAARKLSTSVARAVALAATALVVAGCGSDGPASYVGAADNAAIYLSWTQSGDELDGQITQSLADSDPLAGEVDTNRASFTGTADGDAVSLRIDRGLGSTSTITGTIDGTELRLSFPGQDGGSTPIVFREGGDAEYNAALARLREKTGQQKSAAEAEARESQAREDGTDAAAAVHGAVTNLQSSADTAGESNPAEYDVDLATIQAALDTVKASYEVVQQAIDNSYNDTICDDAGVLGDEVSNMRREIGNMRGNRARNRDPNQLSDDIKLLREKFAELQAIDAQYRPADSPSKSDVDKAIADARAQIRAQGGRGADFGAADKLLSQAVALQVKADAACERLGQ